MCAAWLVLAHYNISHAKVSESAKARSSKHDEQSNHHFTTSSTHYYESMHAHISLTSLPFCCLCGSRSCVVATGYLPCAATCPTDTVSMSVRSVSQSASGRPSARKFLEFVCIRVVVERLLCQCVYSNRHYTDRCISNYCTDAEHGLFCVLCLLILLLFSDMPAYEECWRASRSCVCG